MKVAINRCYGGFSISKACAEWMANLGHQPSIKALYEWHTENRAIQSFLNDGVWPEGIKHVDFLTIRARYKQEASWFGFYMNDERDHPLLIQAIETLGKAANGENAELEIITIPDGTKYVIEEYDGIESIHEEHRSWG